MSARSQSLPHSGARLTARAAILAVLVVIVAALSIVPTRQFLAQRAQIERLEQANGQLESQIAKLHDSAELERLARECLGMVKPGETAFVTVPKHGEPQPSRC